MRQSVVNIYSRRCCPQRSRRHGLSWV